MKTLCQTCSPSLFASPHRVRASAGSEAQTVASMDGIETAPSVSRHDHGLATTATASNIHRDLPCTDADLNHRIRTIKADDRGALVCARQACSAPFMKRQDGGLLFTVQQERATIATRYCSREKKTDGCIHADAGAWNRCRLGSRKRRHVQTCDPGQTRRRDGPQSAKL